MAGARAERGRWKWGSGCGELLAQGLERPMAMAVHAAAAAAKTLRGGLQREAIEQGEADGGGLGCGKAIQQRFDGCAAG